MRISSTRSSATAQDGENASLSRISAAGEFPANRFELVTDENPPKPIDESRDLGIMLCDMDFCTKKNIQPMFFHAEMVNGVVDVEGKEVLR